MLVRDISVCTEIFNVTLYEIYNTRVGSEPVHRMHQILEKLELQKISVLYYYFSYIFNLSDDFVNVCVCVVFSFQPVSAFVVHIYWLENLSLLAPSSIQTILNPLRIDISPSIQM